MRLYLIRTQGLSDAACLRRRRRSWCRACRRVSRASTVLLPLRRDPHQHGDAVPGPRPEVVEISLVTALWKLSVVLLVVWGYLTLGEDPSFLGVGGVLVCVAGVYLINVSPRRRAAPAPLVSLIRDPGQRLHTLGAALFYAPSVVIIKKIALLLEPHLRGIHGLPLLLVLITPGAVSLRCHLPASWDGTGSASWGWARVRRAVHPARTTVHDDRQLVRRGRQADRNPAGDPHRLADVRRRRTHPPDLARLRRHAAGHRHSDPGQGLTVPATRAPLLRRSRSPHRPLAATKASSTFLGVRTDGERPEAAHGRSAMRKYMFEVSGHLEGARGVAKDGGTKRRAAVEAGLKSLGGKLEAFYFAYGEMDAFVIVDLPDW